MKALLKLTLSNGTPILIGVDSIITVEKITLDEFPRIDTGLLGYSKISSRHAMVTSNIVRESIEEIYKLYSE